MTNTQSLVETAKAMVANGKGLLAMDKSNGTLCQEAGLVPIVEPEVLMDGSQPLACCQEATEAVLRSVFGQLTRQGVVLDAMILKPNRVIAGLSYPTQNTAQEVADATVQCPAACGTRCGAWHRLPVWRSFWPTGQ